MPSIEEQVGVGGYCSAVPPHWLESHWWEPPAKLAQLHPVCAALTCYLCVLCSFMLFCYSMLFMLLMFFLVRPQVSAVGELVKEGKIKYWGLSNETTFGEAGGAAGRMPHVAVAMPVLSRSSLTLLAPLSPPPPRCVPVC